MCLLANNLKKGYTVTNLIKQERLVFSMSNGAHPFGRKKKFEVTIHPDYCTGCGYCARFCVMECISQRADGIYQINPDMCIGCRACRANCPYDAVTVVDNR